MNSNVILKPAVAIASAAALIAAVPPPPTTQRPIADFVANAGPSASKFVSFFDAELQPQDQVFLRFDYVGQVNTQNSLGLPTSYSGKVTETDLGGGQVRIHVRLHTRDGLVWVVNPSNVAVFGVRPSMVGLPGQEPIAVADGLFTITAVLNQAPGQPIPNLWALTPAQGYRERLTFTCSGMGTFTSASAYPAGTPATCHTTQVALFQSPADPLAEDPWPAEKVILEPISSLR
jgi:hypothetical protein